MKGEKETALMKLSRNRKRTDKLKFTDRFFNAIYKSFQNIRNKNNILFRFVCS